MVWKTLGPGPVLVAVAAIVVVASLLADRGNWNAGTATRARPRRAPAPEAGPALPELGVGNRGASGTGSGIAAPKRVDPQSLSWSPVGSWQCSTLRASGTAELQITGSGQVTTKEALGDGLEQRCDGDWVALVRERLLVTVVCTAWKPGGPQVRKFTWFLHLSGPRTLVRSPRGASRWDCTKAES